MELKTHIVKGQTITSIDTYRKHYRNKENPPLKKGETIKDYNAYAKIMSLFSEAISIGMTETPGGVWIKGLGYFTVGLIPKKQFNSNVVKGGEMANQASGFKIYKATFIPAFFGTRDALSTFVMENSASVKYVKARLKHQIKSGFKYRTYMYTFLYSRRRGNTRRWSILKD